MNARVIGEAAFFLLIALAATVGHALLDREALFWDEYYQLLAARSWAADGTLSIGDGVYERAAWLSIAVGWLFRTFGESVLLARAAAAAVCALWAGVLFLWIRLEVGRAAAWLTGILFVLCPIALVNGVMVRFYAILGLLITLVVIMVHALVVRARGFRGHALLLLTVTLLTFVAYRISSLTRVWILGLVLWAAVAYVVRRVPRSRLAAVAVASGLLAVVGALTAWQTGWLGSIWTVYTHAPDWGVDRATDVRWYERMIRADYPLLWGLFPVAGVTALLRHPTLASACLSVFVVGFAGLSGAGPKAERYVLPLLPYFFALWGIAIGAGFPALRSWLNDVVGSLFGFAPDALRRVGATGLLLIVLGFSITSNPGFVRLREVPRGTVTSLDRDPHGIGTSPQEWDEAAPMIAAASRDVDAIVTANSLQMLYHVGDYDYAMRPVVVAELSPPEEFTVDHRTGRPAISTLASLQQVIRDHPTGLIVGEIRRWEHAFEGFTPEVSEYVYSHLEEVTLPRRLGIRAYRWGPNTDG